MSIKPYNTEEHLNIKKIIEEQIDYVHKTIKDEKNPDQFARLSPDTLSMVLMELTAMYESLSKWLADEKLHIADLKTARQIKFADNYCALKKMKAETNETARMKSTLLCAEDDENINRYKHGFDIIEAWKKSLARYHDAVRSQLSYEKSVYGMSRGQ